MTWTEFSENWITGSKALWQQAQDLYGAKVRANPKAYEPQVGVVIRDLANTRLSLDRMKANLGTHGRTEDWALFNRLHATYYKIAEQFYADTRPADQAALGFLPVLIVLGLAVGVTGTAFAAAWWHHTNYLVQQTGLAEKDLAARVEASRAGRTLQNTTLPQPPPEVKPEDGLKTMGKWLLGGLAVVTGFLVVPPLLSKPRN